MKDDRKRPTAAQLEYARELIQETKVDPAWYINLESRSRRQVQEVIDELRYIKDGGENLCTIQGRAKSDGRDIGTDSTSPGDIL